MLAQLWLVGACLQGSLLKRYSIFVRYILWQITYCCKFLVIVWTLCLPYFYEGLFYFNLFADISSATDSESDTESTTEDDIMCDDDAENHDVETQSANVGGISDDFAGKSFIFEIIAKAPVSGTHSLG